jgi:hypothetical protein
VVAITPPSATACAQSAVTFTANGANTYAWNGSPASSIFQTSASSNTTYVVTGTNPQGCSTSQTVGLTINPLPVVAITPSLVTVCANSNLTLSVGGASTYLWGNGATSTSIVITPTALGTYSATGTSSLGCVSVAQAIVLTNPSPTINVTPANGTVCAFSPINLTASGASTYTWSGGAGNSASVTITPSASVVYTVAGTETVNLCSASRTVAVTVNALPVIGVSSSNASVCTGSTATLTASGATTYTWSMPGSANVSTVIVTPSTGQVFTVTGTDNFGCVGTSTATVGMFPQPNIVPSPAQQTICLNETASVTASGAISYTWTASSGNTLSGSSYTASPVTLEQIQLSGTDANSCVANTVVTVYVSQCTGLTTNAVNSNLITVFPNPSAGVVTARFEYEGRKEIRVYNAIGQAIELRITESESEEFNLSQYAKGVYYVQVNSKKASANFRIIIQ